MSDETKHSPEWRWDNDQLLAADDTVILEVEDSESEDSEGNRTWGSGRLVVSPEHRTIIAAAPTTADRLRRAVELLREGRQALGDLLFVWNPPGGQCGGSLDQECMWKDGRCAVHRAVAFLAEVDKDGT